MKKLSLLLFLILLQSCDFHFPGIDEKFGKQNFVSAISMIELHKLRNGKYPNSLSELQYLGDWDAIWLAGVRYEKEGNGYNLYVERGWAGKPQLSLPEGFRNGLGLIKSNVSWIIEDKK